MTADPRTPPSGDRRPTGRSNSRPDEEPRRASAPRRPGALRRLPVERVTVTEGEVYHRSVRDVLTTEEPLEVVLVDGERREPLSVTMRTPGADFDLVAGALYADGIIDGARDLVTMRYCTGDGSPGAAAAVGPRTQLYNRVEVRLAHARESRAPPGRRRFTASSCGVCGMDSIEAVLSLACPPVRNSRVVSAELLLSLPAELRRAQSQFERTGGLHAAALFDHTGALLCIREDVGRHNALDKLIGASVLAGEVPLTEGVLLLSSRLSFELVQKASRAGIAVVAGVSAPSTLAVDLAERTGITLIGFLRESGFNLYTGGRRVGFPTRVDLGSER